MTGEVDETGAYLDWLPDVSRTGVRLNGLQGEGEKKDERELERSKRKKTRK